MKENIEPILIHAEPTSNPNALKFRLSRNISINRTLLSQAILALGIIDEIEIDPSSITVFKKPASNWGNLLPHVEKIILENLAQAAK